MSLKPSENDFSHVVKEIWDGVKSEREALIISILLSGSFVAGVYILGSFMFH